MIDRQRQPHSYVEHLEESRRMPVQARLRRRFLRFARLGRGQRVLEVGAGTGIVTRDAAALVGPRGRVIGVDPSRVMTAAARRIARRPGLGRQLVHEIGDGARLRFAAGRFDCVFAVTVLLHVQDSEAILRDMLRVTRRALNAVRRGLASAGAAARWTAAIERLAASGQFAFTLNYYAAWGIRA